MSSRLGRDSGGNSSAFFGFARPFLNHLRPHDGGYGGHHKVERAAATGVVVPSSRIIQAKKLRELRIKGERKKEW
ncbi:hypothetical protein NL676_019368 [Syzygium grande]|nr:hypothetical protein NL676_019368 [Syzygium grande]